MSRKDRAPESQVWPGEHVNVGPPATGTASAAPNSQRQSGHRQTAQRQISRQSAQHRSADHAATPRRRGWRTPSKTGGTENAGWQIISYLVAGMLLYGGLGWLIARWTGMPAALLPVGILVGLVLALVLVVLRYGRS